MTAVFDVGAGVFGALFGRRKLTTAAGSLMRGATRASSRESGDVGRAEETLASVQMQLHELQVQLDEEIYAIQTRMDASNEPLEVVSVKPKKSNIQVRLLTLAWAPYDENSKPAWE